MNLLEIQKGFQKFDKNGDGHITVEELQEARKKFEEENSADHANDMIKDVDRNGNMLFLKKYLPLLYLYNLKCYNYDGDGTDLYCSTIQSLKGRHCSWPLELHLSWGGRGGGICLVIDDHYIVKKRRELKFTKAKILFCSTVG